MIVSLISTSKEKNPRQKILDSVELPAMTSQKIRKRTVTVGDVFAVPLQGKGFGYGQIIYWDGRWRIAQFFDYWSAAATYSESILSSTVSLPPYCIATDKIESGQWPIVHHMPDTTYPCISSLEFYKGLAGNRSVVRIDGSTGPISEEKAKTLASSMPQMSQYVVQMLSEHLEVVSRRRALN